MLGMAALALVFSNCSNEELENVASQKVTSIKATIEQPVIARSTVDNTTGKFAWAEGDSISVYDGSKFVKFIYNESSKDFSAEGDVTPTELAYYPANYKWHQTDKYAIAEGYQYGTTNAPMKATIDPANPNEMNFKHLGGVVYFKLNNVPAKANKFTFTNNDGKITGRIKISQNDKGEEVIKKEDAGSKNAISISFSQAADYRDLEFYIPVPVGTYGDFTIQLFAGSDEIFSKTAKSTKNVIERATLLKMPAIDVVDLNVILDTAKDGITFPANASSSWANNIEVGTWSYFIAEGNSVALADDVISIDSKVEGLAWNKGAVAFYRFPQGVEKGIYELTLKFKSNTAAKQAIIRFIKKKQGGYDYLNISENKDNITATLVYPKFSENQVTNNDFIDLKYYVDFSNVDDSSNVFLNLCANLSHLALFQFKDIQIVKVAE